MCIGLPQHLSSESLNRASLYHAQFPMQMESYLQCNSSKGSSTLVTPELQGIIKPDAGAPKSLTGHPGYRPNVHSIALLMVFWSLAHQAKALPGRQVPQEPQEERREREGGGRGRRLLPLLAGSPGLSQARPQHSHWPPAWQLPDAVSAPTALCIH